MGCNWEGAAISGDPPSLLTTLTPTDKHTAPKVPIVVFIETLDEKRIPGHAQCRGLKGSA